MWITDSSFHLTNFCLQIHEEIEEVVTTYSDSDDGNTSPPFDQKHKICLNISSSDTAEFPELGMELRGAGRGRGEEGGLVLSPPDTSWHHNWLFRRQLSSAARPRVCPPVSMLVPNPSSEVPIRATIGDRDVDEGPKRLTDTALFVHPAILEG